MANTAVRKSPSAKIVRVVTAVGGFGEVETETNMSYQQVNGRLLVAFPATRVFEFRVEAGILASVQMLAADNVTADVTFDIKKGTRVANLTSIFALPANRPKILAGGYLIEITPNLAVANNDLISIDVASASENLRFLTVRARVVPA